MSTSSCAEAGILTQIGFCLKGDTCPWPAWRADDVCQNLRLLRRGLIEQRRDFPHTDGLHGRRRVKEQVIGADMKRGGQVRKDRRLSFVLPVSMWLICVVEIFACSASASCEILRLAKFRMR